MSDPRLLVDKLTRDKAAAMAECDASRDEVAVAEERLNVVRATAAQRFNVLVGIEQALSKAQAELANWAPQDVTSSCQRDHTKLRTAHCPMCGLPKEAKSG